MRNVPLVHALRASPSELTGVLSRAGFSSVVVNQHIDGARIRTEVTAATGDLRPIAALAGGDLKFESKPDNFVEIGGKFGGALGESNADLSALSGIRLTLWIVVPGTVRRADRAAEVSHVADSATWKFPVDRLLAQPRTLDVLVLPRIEGTWFYWLALILGVTALVIVGAVIVLRRGRDARV